MTQRNEFMFSAGDSKVNAKLSDRAVAILAITVISGLAAYISASYFGLIPINH